jgi:hypothetical protein
MGIQHKTSSVQSKTHVGDSKYGVVMIPFSDCLWDDTCLPNFRFSTKWAHSIRSITHYLVRICSCSSKIIKTIYGGLYTKWNFTLGIKIKETQELSNSIGRELKIGSKGFILGVQTKVCQNDLAPMWHHFGAKFSWS